ncbi:DUF3558 domain-containing protein [Actinophytocola sp.]|uniref:DUF3558 domain-containing protein n=1 Tax=Actinophytocola sp. TaxID=1872138 RepID=UPI003899B044
MSCRPGVAVVATLVVLLAGCSESTQGSPTPGGEPTSTPTSTSEGTTEESSTPAQPSGTADLQPCGILDQSDLAGLQLTGGEQKEVGSARVCRYRRQGATLNETFTVSIELFDHEGLADLDVPDVQQLPRIGSHDAAKYTDETGTCGVSLGVGDNSRVDSAAVGGDQQLGCQIAQQLATLVEPKLP